MSYEDNVYLFFTFDHANQFIDFLAVSASFFSSEMEFIFFVVDLSKGKKR